MKRLLSLALVLVPLAAACSGSISVEQRGADGGVITQGRVPKQHRPSAVECDRRRPDTEPTDIPDSGLATCRVNADCTQGTNGRCNGNGHDGWACTYDKCFSDADCSGSGGVCECEGQFRSDANMCIAGNCRVDGDCGAGGFCSPSLGSCGHYNKNVGYFCHTPSDECIDDADCSSPAGRGGYCAFDSVAKRWKCSTAECAG
jgi:hypothetical protein